MISQIQLLDNLKLFAGADIPRSGGATAGVQASPAILARGEIVVTDAGDNILDTTTVLLAPAIKIVMGRGTGVNLWQSQMFTYNDATRYEGRQFQAKVQEVYRVGYNGVSATNDFDVAPSTYYDLVISFYELLSQEASALYNPIIVEHFSGTNPTTETIANGLFANLVAQLNNWVRRPIRAEVINSENATVISPSATATMAFGSKTILISNTTGFAAGDYFRDGLGVTNGVYKIASVTTNVSLNLEVAYQGTNTSLTNVQFEGIAEVVAQAASFGIQLTGLNSPFVLDSRPVSLVSFQVGLKNGGSTPRNLITTSFIGHGTYELIRTEEADSWRNQGQLFTYTEFPPTTIETDITNTAQNFATLFIGLNKQVGNLSLGNMAATLEIACALDNNVANTFDTNFTGNSTSVVDVLDVYMTQNPALTAQLGNL